MMRLHGNRARDVAERACTHLLTVALAAVATFPRPTDLHEPLWFRPLRSDQVQQLTMLPSRLSHPREDSEQTRASDSTNTHRGRCQAEHAADHFQNRQGYQRFNHSALTPACRRANDSVVFQW